MVKESQATLPKETVAQLLEAMSPEAWRLIHSMLCNPATTFTAPVVKAAAEAQAFTKSLVASLGDPKP